MRLTSLLLAAILCASAGLAWATNWKVPNKLPPQMPCSVPCHAAFDKCKNKVFAKFLAKEDICCTDAEKAELTKCTSTLYQCLKPCPAGPPEHKPGSPPTE